MNNFNLTRLFTILALFFVTISGASFAQLVQQTPNQLNTCFFDEVLQEHLNSDSNHQIEFDKMNHSIKEFIDQKEKGQNGVQLKSSNANITIPVVVYIVHNYGPENISDVQVISQIDALNTYFDGHGINFCLAPMNGTQSIGTTSPGIIRLHNPSLTHNIADPNYGTPNHVALTATSNLSNQKYMRVWIVNDINNGTAKGYSILPGAAPANVDGIVMAYDAFGDIANCNCTGLASDSEQGKTMVHEVGHYLGLYHTFQNSCSGTTANDCDTQGDRVCDTPPVAGPNYGCPAVGWNTCVETPDLPDDINNYMDYTSEACSNNFTSGQEDRMFAAIALYRSELVSSNNYAHTGITCNGSLIAGFTVSNHMSCVGDAVNFNAAFVSGGTYSWDFGDGTTGVGQSPTHTYSSVYMPLSVVLTVSDGVNSVSNVQSLYIDNCSSIQNATGNWIFGDECALDFSTGAAVYSNVADVNDRMVGNANEAVAVQNTSSGQLLFYTNGEKIWDASHVQLASNIGGHHSSSTGSIIIPDPVTSNHYYIFNTGYAGGAFSYCKVAVSGLQASVISTNNVINASAGYETVANGSVVGGEGVTAIAGCNNTYWILTKGKKNVTNSFLMVYRLDGNGLVFHSEMSLPDVNLDFVTIEASPNGNKVALTQSVGGDIHVLDFDYYTGQLSNLKDIDRENIYGLCFSPDSKLLYAVKRFSKEVYQYNVVSPNPELTEIQIGELTGTLSGSFAMQMGPDNKIYISQISNQLAVIHRPNNMSNSGNPNNCLFDTHGPHLDVLYAGTGLPNFLDASNDNVFNNDISYTVNNCNIYTFTSGVCANTFSWNFGDPTSGSSNTSSSSSPTHTFSSDGTYTITLTAGGSVVLTTTIQIGISASILGTSTICSANSTLGDYSISLSPGSTVVWSVNGGSVIGLGNQTNISVDWASLPGTITATITDNVTGCSKTESFSVTEYCSVQCSCDLNPYFKYKIDNDCKVEFFDESGVLPCLTDVTYTWDFGDNTPVFVGQNPPLHIFPSAGTYQVCLTVSASNGNETCTKTYCNAVKVKCDPPCECDNFDMGLDYTFNKDLCLFTFTGFDNLPSCFQNVEYLWKFGDNTTSIGQTVGHIYTFGNYHTVCLIINVYDDEGELICSKEKCIEIKVRCHGDCACSLDPYFDVSSNIYCDYLFTAHSGSNCVNIESYEWYVNGAGPYSGQTLSQTFTTNQLYEVCLVVKGYTEQGKCKKKVCVDYFNTDCYPEFGKSNTKLEEQIILAPNPATKEVSINFSKLESTNVMIRLKTADGKEVKSYKVDSENNEEFVNLQLAGLANGLYLIEITSKDFSVTKRLIIQK